MTISPEAAVTFTVNVTVRPVVFAGIVPMFQVTTPPDSVPPPVAETKAVPDGTVSVMTTPLIGAAVVLP